MAYANVTLATLKTRLDDRLEISSFYTAAEKLLALNEAIRLWNLFTGTWRQRITHALQVESDPYFALPQSMTFAMTMSQAGTPMAKASLMDLDYGKPGWEGQSIGDTGVPTAPRVWAPVSLTLMTYWPKVIATGVTLTIDGVADTPVLAADGDFIDLNESRHSILLDYAKHYLNLKRGSAELQQTQPALKAFMASAADENALFRESSFFRWAMARDDKLKLTPFHAPVKETQRGR